jgi:microcin C transport system permease protein
VQILTKKMTPMTRRSWNAFFAQTRARVGLRLLTFIIFVSFTAEIWSNHNPLILIRDVPVQGSDNQQVERRFFFPAFHNYSVKDFGIEDSFVVDFREILETDKAENRFSFAIFPINRWDPYIQTSDILAPPSLDHFLGTDNLGRDVVARLIYGLRVSIFYGLMYWLGSFLIGISIGATQGYFGGKADFFIERFKELLEILPFLSIIILVNGLTQNSSIWITLGVVLIFTWIGISAQIRAQFLSLRKREYCEAGRAIGGSHAHIMMKHILPNALTPIITFSPFTVSAGISILTTLDYLGFGLAPPTPSLGELLAQGQEYIRSSISLLLAPAITLVIVLFSINLIGESLRQAFDPRKS